MDALYVVENALVSSASARITALALDTRLPTMFNIGTAVQVGALLAYGPNFPAMYKEQLAKLTVRTPSLRSTNIANSPLLVV